MGNTRQRPARKPGTETYTSMLRPKLPGQVGAVLSRGAGLAVSRARAAAKQARKNFGKTLKAPAKGTPPPLPPAFYRGEKERSDYLNKIIRVPIQDQGI